MNSTRPEAIGGKNSRRRCTGNAEKSRLRTHQGQIDLIGDGSSPGLGPHFYDAPMKIRKVGLLIFGTADASPEKTILIELVLLRLQ